MSSFPHPLMVPSGGSGSSSGRLIIRGGSTKIPLHERFARLQQTSSSPGVPGENNEMSSVPPSRSSTLTRFVPVSSLSHKHRALSNHFESANFSSSPYEHEEEEFPVYNPGPVAQTYRDRNNQYVPGPSSYSPPSFGRGSIPPPPPPILSSRPFASSEPPSSFSTSYRVRSRSVMERLGYVPGQNRSDLMLRKTRRPEQNYYSARNRLYDGYDEDTVPSYWKPRRPRRGGFFGRGGRGRGYTGGGGFSRWASTMSLGSLGDGTAPNNQKKQRPRFPTNNRRFWYRRGGGFRSRGRGGSRFGARRRKPQISKEDLDKEIDQYMSNTRLTRTALDKEIDKYMATAIVKTE